MPCPRDGPKAVLFFMLWAFWQVFSPLYYCKNFEKWNSWKFAQKNKLDCKIFVLHNFHFLLKFISETQNSFFPDHHGLCLCSPSDLSWSNYRYRLRSVWYSNYGFSCSWYWQISFTHRSGYLCQGYFSSSSTTKKTSISNGFQYLQMVERIKKVFKHDIPARTR